MEDEIVIRPLLRFLIRYGHYAATILAYSALAMFLCGFFISTVGIATWIGSLIFFVGSYLLMAVSEPVHAAGVCQKCVPLAFEGEAKAEANANRLSRFHLLKIKYVYLIMGGAFIALLLLPYPARRLFAVVTSAIYLYGYLIYATHSRLEQWCPWCGDDEGWEDDEEDPVAPEPTPPGKEIKI